MDKISPEKRQEYIDVLQECLDGKWKDPEIFQYMLERCEACKAYELCEDCPICMATGKVQCQHTPVYRYYSSTFNDDGWAEMIKNERLFLQAVIAHLKAGHELDKFKEMTDYDWEKDL